MLVEPNDMPPPYQGTSIVIFGPRVVAAVEQQPGGDVLAAQTGGRGVREAEPQPVEAAAGGADLALQVLAGRPARLGHLPGAHEQVGRPAVIAHRLEDRILGQRERALRAGGDAVVVRLLAVRPDAAIVERPDDVPIALRAASARRAGRSPRSGRTPRSSTRGGRCTCRSRCDSAAGAGRTSRRDLGECRARTGEVVRGRYAARFGLRLLTGLHRRISLDSIRLSLCRTAGRTCRVPGPRRTCTAGLAAQPTHLANAHRAEHLDQLLVPGPHQVHDAVDGVVGVDLLQGDRAGLARARTRRTAGTPGPTSGGCRWPPGRRRR